MLAIRTDATDRSSIQKTLLLGLSLPNIANLTLNLNGGHNIRTLDSRIPLLTDRQPVQSQGQLTSRPALPACPCYHAFSATCSMRCMAARLQLLRTLRHPPLALCSWVSEPRAPALLVLQFRSETKIHRESIEDQQEGRGKGRGQKKRGEVERSLVDKGGEGKSGGGGIYRKCKQITPVEGESGVAIFLSLTILGTAGLACG